MPPLIIAIIAIAAITSIVTSIVAAANPPKPPSISFGYQGSSSPTYGTFGPLNNTISNEIAIPVLYGQVKLAGNVIWQTDPGQNVARIVGLCEGQINKIFDVRGNDEPITDDNTPGSSYTAYVGTNAQEADSRVPADLRPDLALKRLAYLALTLQTGDKIKGGNPTITCIAQGVLVETWNGASWPVTKSYSRNPAACLRDFLINTRYGLGIPKANIDDASFGTVYDYCEGSVGSVAPSNSALLIHLDTDFTDSSTTPKTVTAFGGAVIDKTIFRFGEGSCSFPGNAGDYIASLNNNAFKFGTGDFGVNVNVMWRSHAANGTIFMTDSTGGGNYFGIGYVTATGKLRIYLNGTEIDFAFTPTDNVWYNIEVSRASGFLYVFIEGVQQGSAVANATNLSTGDDAVFGGDNGGWLGPFNGWIDEGQVISGSAIHTDDFTPALASTTGSSEARYRLDYVIDSQKPANDVLNDILSTFMGFLVFAGSVVKLRCERTETVTQYFGDGSSTAQNATFDPNNIVKDSFTWNRPSQDDRPNRIRLQWVDPNQNYVKVYAQMDDRIDQDDRGGVIVKDYSLLGITRQTQALRMAKLFMSKAKYSSINVQFSARLESVHCEVGDVVAVTHQAARYANKLFRISDMQEAQDETIAFTCSEYNPYIYDDGQGSSVIVMSQPSGPNLYSPLDDITGLTLMEDNFKQKDGTFVTNILTSWTAIAGDELLRLDRYLIQISSDNGVSFRDVAFASADKTSYRIVLGNVQTGTTFRVRVLTISDRGAQSPGTDADITINGKVTPISDVEDFSVTFGISPNRISFNWSAVDDSDLFAYEIRVGDSSSRWETASIVATEILTSHYELFNFTSGAKKFFVKAIDNSGNYSEHAASDSINITSIPDSNVVFSYDIWQFVTVRDHPLQGALSASLEKIPTNDFDPTYNRIALAPLATNTFLSLQQSGQTYAQVQASGFLFGLESYVTSQESYITTAIDIGAVFTGSFILDIRTFSSSNLGFVSVYISTSSDNVTWTAFAPYTNGQYTARYVKFEFLIQATDASTRVRLISAILTVDVPDRKQLFSNQAISASGTAIALSNFTSVKSIVATTVGTSNLTPQVTDKTGLPTSFTLALFDVNGVAQAGVCDLTVWGY